MAKFQMSRSLYEQVMADLSGEKEQVGFLLADFHEETATFAMREWRAVPVGGFEYQSAHHVTLTDEMKTEIIRWAWDAGASLVEAHSHGDLFLAEFSPSDLSGLHDWVPHLFWRLQRKPYAALVTGGRAFDALAWIQEPGVPRQVDAIVLDDGSNVAATGRTLAPFGHRDGDRLHIERSGET